MRSFHVMIWTNQMSWRALDHFLDEVGFIGCVFMPKMTSHAHDLWKELCAKTCWRMRESGCKMVIMGTLTKETEGKWNWVPHGGHGCPHWRQMVGWKGALVGRVPNERYLWKSNLDTLGKPRGSQPIEVVDTPLLERAPRGVAKEQRVLRMPPRNRPKMR